MKFEYILFLGYNWQQVIIASGNGLVLLGNKPSCEAV